MRVIVSCLLASCKLAGQPANGDQITALILPLPSHVSRRRLSSIQDQGRRSNDDLGPVMHGCRLQKYGQGYCMISAYPAGGRTDVRAFRTSLRSAFSLSLGSRHSMAGCVPKCARGLLVRNLGLVLDRGSYDSSLGSRPSGSGQSVVSVLHCAR